MIFSPVAGPPPGLNARTITGPTTATAASFDALTVNALAGAVTINPPANTPGAVWWVTKSDTSASAVTLAATIDGVVNPTLVFTGQIAEIVGDGTTWQRVVRPGIFQAPDLSQFPGGLTGASGAPGTVWWVGTGAPGTVTGAVTGDYYINKTNGEVYKSTSGASTWVDQSFSLQGPAGSAGASGNTLFFGGLTGLVAAGDPMLQAVGAGAITANRIMLRRVIVPKAGTLHDFAAYIGVSSGNVIASVYDTGQASSGNLTRLWQSGSIATPAGAAWRIIADPALTVTAGQELLLGLMPDNTTATFGQGAAAASAAGSQLPFAAVNGISPYVASYFAAGSFAAPATISNASLNSFGTPFGWIARVA